MIFPLLSVALTPKAQDFVSVFTTERWHKAMANTALECVCSTALSVLIGYIYAYATVRVSIPFKRFFASVPIIHLVTPPFVGGLAFILLIGRQGFITHTLLHLNVSLYGFFGLLIAQTLTFFPIAYLFCAQALRAIPNELEQAALGMGASRVRVFFTVTLPLSGPGILGAALFIAVSVLSDFGNPLIVAGRFSVLAVEIYTQINGWLNAGKSTVLALVLLIPSIALFIAQHKALKAHSEHIAIIGARLSSSTQRKAAPLTRILCTVFCLFISFTIIAQFIAIVAGSFQKLWGVNTSFTLDHIKSVARWTGALKNTLAFSFIASFCGTIVAVFTAYITSRTKLPLKGALDCISQLPAAIPGSLFGLALSLASSAVHIKMPRILIISAMMVAFLPFSYRILSTTYAQIKTSLDEASYALGAGRLCTLGKVIIPLSVRGIFSSIMYSFVRGVGTVSSVIFLISFGTPLASVTILNLAEQGDWGGAAALAMVLTSSVFFIVLAGNFFTKKIGGQYAA